MSDLADLPAEPVRQGRAPRLRTRLLVTLAAPFVGFGLIELVLRTLLFTDFGRSLDWAASLREPQRYAAVGTESEADYWRLLYATTPPEERWLPPPHTELGWLREDVDGATFVHEALTRLNGRRPVLLFGSSFVRCMPEVELCHEDLFERSPFAAELALINYANTGYGLAQTTLLAKHAVDALRPLDPVVIVAIQMDADLMRMSLDFRHGPKPYLAVGADGEVQLHRPTATDVDAFLEESPVGIRSYVWNHLLYGSEILPLGLRAKLRKYRAVRARTAVLVSRVLLALEHDLADLEHFVLLLGERSTLDEAPADLWQHQLVHASLDAVDAPFVSAHRMLGDAVAAGEGAADDYFLQADGHPNQRGVELIQRAIERGLRGEFDTFEAIELSDD